MRQLLALQALALFGALAPSSAISAQQSCEAQLPPVNPSSGSASCYYDAARDDFTCFSSCYLGYYDTSVTGTGTSDVYKCTERLCDQGACNCASGSTGAPTFSSACSVVEGCSANALAAQYGVTGSCPASPGNLFAYGGYCDGGCTPSVDKTAMSDITGFQCAACGEPVLDGSADCVPEKDYASSVELFGWASSLNITHVTQRKSFNCTCRTGYWVGPAGSYNWVCDSFLGWGVPTTFNGYNALNTNSNAVCQACGTAPSLADATVSFARSNYAAYTCNINYTSSTGRALSNTCSTSRGWAAATATGSCVLCGAVPQPAHGNCSPVPNTRGAICSCSAGYYGPSSVSCNAVTGWGSTTCMACGNLATLVPNADCTVTQTGRTSVANCTCRAGFESTNGNGLVSTTCSAAPGWNVPDGSCFVPGATPSVTPSSTPSTSPSGTPSNTLTPTPTGTPSVTPSSSQTPMPSSSTDVFVLTSASPSPTRSQGSTLIPSATPSSHSCATLDGPFDPNAPCSPRLDLRIVADLPVNFINNTVLTSTPDVPCAIRQSLATLLGLDVAYVDYELPYVMPHRGPSAKWVNCTAPKNVRRSLLGLQSSSITQCTPLSNVTWCPADGPITWNTTNLEIVVIISAQDTVLALTCEEAAAYQNGQSLSVRLRLWSCLFDRSCDFSRFAVDSQVFQLAQAANTTLDVVRSSLKATDGTPRVVYGCVNNNIDNNDNPVAPDNDVSKAPLIGAIVGGVLAALAVLALALLALRRRRNNDKMDAHQRATERMHAVNPAPANGMYEMSAATSQQLQAIKAGQPAERNRFMSIVDMKQVQSRNKNQFGPVKTAGQAKAPEGEGASSAQLASLLAQRKAARARNRGSISEPSYLRKVPMNKRKAEFGQSRPRLELGEQEAAGRGAAPEGAVVAPNPVNARSTSANRLSAFFGGPFGKAR